MARVASSTMRPWRELEFWDVGGRLDVDGKRGTDVFRFLTN